MSKIMKCNRVALDLSVFAKILQKHVNKYQKRHKVDTIDSITNEKSSKTTKYIPRPKTTKISIRMQQKTEWDVSGAKFGK